MTRLRNAAVRFAYALILLVVAGMAGCGGLPPAGFSGDVDVLLARGQAYAEFTARQPVGTLSDEDVLALGYLERARVGLGSPFRLIDFALHDPGLSPERREVLAFALLARTLRGEIYQVDPSVLEYVRLTRVRPRYELGAQQLRVIEQTIAAAPTAKSGEMAVRLGYQLAQAERTVVEVPFSVVAHVAAMAADRRRAREDAALLLRTAAQRSVGPLELLVAWRRELRFQVEGPVLGAPSVREDEWEARDGPQVALALRTIAQRLGSPASLVPDEARPAERAYPSVLAAAAAERLRRVAEERDYPAQAPIAVAVSINREAFLGNASLTEETREARRAFSDGSWNEERLVAEAARLRATPEAGGRRLSLILLQASTFFRVWNQEEPWFPGDPAPAARDLEARFGLAGVEFDDAVATSWRPFYLRMLARGLTDLERVLPTASVRGLRIRVGAMPEGANALALHDPATRTLILPPHTGSGTLAHEIAHDLDWQLARKRYGRRGGYATDLAVRRGAGDRIASSLTGLAASLAPPPSDTIVRPHDTRPAEVFARGSDWLVATMLARQGRTGGYLTSYQDAALTGYGTTRGPDVDGGAVPNLLSILDAVAPVVDGSREWVLDRYGPSHFLSPTEMVRPLLRAAPGGGAEERMAAIAAARDRALSAVNGASCRAGSAAGLRRLVAAQRALIQTGAAAALRGAAVDRIHALARESVEPHTGERVDAWVARRLYGSPEAADSALDALAPAFEDVLYRAEQLTRAGGGEIGSPFRTGGEAPLCATNPFASPRRAVPRRPAVAAAPTPRSQGTPATRGSGAFLLSTPWHAAD